MMRKLIVATLLLTFIAGSITYFISCKKQEDTGNIAGVVLDKETEKALGDAEVILKPSEEKTSTDADGRFGFNKLKVGEYVLSVSKTGYTVSDNNKITVVAEKTVQRIIPLEKLLPALQVEGENGQELSSLDFGQTSDSLSFTIVNNGKLALQWQITSTMEWISVDIQSGTLEGGARQKVVAAIDREKLKEGENTTTLYVTSAEGNCQISVRALGEAKEWPELKTLEVANLRSTSVTLRGEIVKTGKPTYTERGFVYGEYPMPAEDNALASVTCDVNENTEFSVDVTGLEIFHTYYVRAYAKNKLGVSYSSNDVSFTPRYFLPEISTKDFTDKSITDKTVTLNGFVDFEGEPAYTEKGFVYGLSQIPTMEHDSKYIVEGGGIGPFSAHLSDFEWDQIYYARAFASNTQGTAYGEPISLDFYRILPNVTTGRVTRLTDSTVKLHGTISSEGEPPFTERGFLLSSSISTPTVENEDPIVISGTDLGEFSYYINTLVSGTVYYARAYAKCEDKVTYGNVEVFKAEPRPYVTYDEMGIMVQKTDLGCFSWSGANDACNNSVLDGYSDWRLPTLEEIEFVYQHRNEIGGWNVSQSQPERYRFWTSTTGTDSDGYLCHYWYSFWGGWSLCYDRGSTCSEVRAVRTITPGE